ncbi:MAG: outer membrane biosynthesis protein TonB [Chlamydiales bacterium]|jgi:outer membrane biosynthesis protein TonB
MKLSVTIGSLMKSGDQFRKSLMERPVASAVWIMVLLFHFSLLLLLPSQVAFSLQKVEVQKVIVKTVQLTPKAVVSKVVQKKEKPEKPIVKTSPKPLPKKKDKPQSTSRKKKKTQLKKNKEVVEKKNKLVDSLKESMALLDVIPEKETKRSSIDVPSEIKKFNVDHLHTPPEQKQNLGFEDYQSSIKRRLKRHLVLPEYGKVEVSLTIGRDGIVKGFEVASSESEKNKLFVESALPAISFPQFGAYFEGEKERTFVMVLSNEI